MENLHRSDHKLTPEDEDIFKSLDLNDLEEDEDTETTDEEPLNFSETNHLLMSDHTQSSNLSTPNTFFYISQAEFMKCFCSTTQTTIANYKTAPGIKTRTETTNSYLVIKYGLMLTRDKHCSVFTTMLRDDLIKRLNLPDNNESDLLLQRISMCLLVLNDVHGCICEFELPSDLRIKDPMNKN